MEKINVIFIGGLTNGKIVFDYLNANKFVNLSLVITYPNGSDKPRHVNFPDAEFILKDGNSNVHVEKIVSLNPDLIIVAGWSELLSAEILNSPKMGVIGFHPSKLPQDRGRSVIAWQIEEGYQETALTMFYYNDIPDGGEIIGQDSIKIAENDYVNDILDKIDLATTNLVRAYFPLIRIGKAPRKVQSINEGNFRRLRTEDDSILNWNSNMDVIYNKIRAISHPYPGAISEIDGKKIKIYKAEKIQSFPFGENLKPGEIVCTLYDKTFVVKCKDGFIKVTKYGMYEQ
jgi:methionyl-tRNA formyltransferase